MRRLKILIFGAGAIGNVFGGFLSQKHDVTLLGRHRIIRSMRRHGIRIKGIWGKHVFRKVEAVYDLRDLGDTKFDLILLTVKSYDTAAAVKLLPKRLKSEGLVISLQNGLGNLETLQKVLDSRRILGGRVIFGAETFWEKSTNAFCVKITVSAEPTAIGALNPQSKKTIAQHVATLIQRSGIPCRAVPNIQMVLWAKIIYNCALNPLASLLGCHYGFLGEKSETRAIMEQVISEIYCLAKAKKIKLQPKTAEAYYRLFYRKLLPRTYYHHPSMLQDLKNKKPTEIMSLNGAVVRLAKKENVRVPVNRFLMNQILTKSRCHA